MVNRKRGGSYLGVEFWGVLVVCVDNIFWAVGIEICCELAHVVFVSSIEFFVVEIQLGLIFFLVPDLLRDFLEWKKKKLSINFQGTKGDTYCLLTQFFEVVVVGLENFVYIFNSARSESELDGDDFGPTGINEVPDIQGGDEVVGFEVLLESSLTGNLGVEEIPDPVEIVARDTFLLLNDIQEGLLGLCVDFEELSYG